MSDEKERDQMCLLYVEKQAFGLFMQKRQVRHLLWGWKIVFGNTLHSAGRPVRLAFLPWKAYGIPVPFYGRRGGHSRHRVGYREYISGNQSVRRRRSAHQADFPMLVCTNRLPDRIIFGLAGAGQWHSRPPALGYPTKNCGKEQPLPFENLPGHHGIGRAAGRHLSYSRSSRRLLPESVRRSVWLPDNGRDNIALFRNKIDGVVLRILLRLSWIRKSGDCGRDHRIPVFDVRFRWRNAEYCRMVLRLHEPAPSRGICDYSL